MINFYDLVADQSNDRNKIKTHAIIWLSILELICEIVDILYLILSSLVQSLTEFLPISSSGHLLILHYFWGRRLMIFNWT
jgi:hypothetical protein